MASPSSKPSKIPSLFPAARAFFAQPVVRRALQWTLAGIAGGLVAAWPIFNEWAETRASTADVAALRGSLNARITEITVLLDVQHNAHGKAHSNRLEEIDLLRMKWAESVRRETGFAARLRMRNPNSRAALQKESEAKALFDRYTIGRGGQRGDAPDVAMRKALEQIFGDGAAED